jgi:predicted nucleic acid-binding protein
LIVVVNTSPLIALDRIGQLEVLKRLFGRIIRPRSVLDELLEGRRVYGGSADLFNASWMDTVDDPAEAVFRKELGAGETAAIVLAKKLNADLVILDDIAARNVAISLDLTVSGTLGVLAAAFRKGYLPSLEKALDELGNLGFRMSKSIREAIISQSRNK